MELINIKDIDLKCKYEGYIWMSDQKRPKKLIKEPIDQKMVESDNPFIIEALLFDEDNMFSYSIKYVDGEYIVTKSEVEYEYLMKDKYETYISKRVNETTKLKFYQKWKSVRDDLCEGMKTKIPSDMIFLGFETSKEKEE